MIIKTTNLLLIREKQQFRASVALSLGLEQYSEFLDQLHPEELMVFNSYQYKRRKNSYLLGRLAAKNAICKLLPNRPPKTIWVDKGVFQFPVVKGINLSNVQVSISHCEAIGCSVAFPEAHPMGIDVERIDEKKLELVLGQLTPDEKSLLSTHHASKLVNYTAFFSIKEALSKVLRTGMMLDPKFMAIATFEKKAEVLECTFTHFGQYKAFAFANEDYVFSIVLPKRTSVDLSTVWQMLENS